MSTLTLASTPEDATALEAAEFRHAQLAAELAGRVSMLLTAANRDQNAAELLHTGLVTFCDRTLLPHTEAEEAVLYAAAHRLPEARLLVESLIAEHRCLTALADALRTAPTAAAAAADARALQVLFEEHAAKDNGLILPLLAATPGICLAALADDMRHRLEENGTVGNSREGRPAHVEQVPESGGCGGACGCGGEAEPAEPELDVRGVPHALRHATVFGALDAVPAGRTMVLVAPHDPLPLLAQIEQRTPDVFAVEYLQRGPQDWRLRLSHR